jgi:hypothetical protein
MGSPYDPGSYLDPNMKYYDGSAKKNSAAKEISAAEAQKKEWDAIQAGGYQLTPGLMRNASSANYGKEQAEKELGDANPYMARVKSIYENLAKGYESEEGGAIRQQARGEIAGSQQAAQRNLQSNLSRGGAGGARAAAIQGAQGQQGVKTAAEAERKMALDSANMQRQGSANLADFIARTQMAKLGVSMGYSGLSSSEYQAEQQGKANKGGDGGMCCFIFLESRYGDGTMDSVVRQFRDENMTEQNRRGYYKLSEVLVPLMRKSKLVKGLVRLFMTDPLVAYGKAYYGTGHRAGFIFAPLKNFWLKTFEYLGGDHKFIRENGEVV